MLLAARQSSPRPPAAEYLGTEGDTCVIGLQGSLVTYLLPAPLQIPSSPHPNEALPTLGPPTTHSCLASGWLGQTSSAPCDGLGGGFLDDDPWVAAALLRLTGGLTNETPT